MLLMVQKSCANRLTCIWTPSNNGINYQPQLVSRISSIDSMTFTTFTILTDIKGYQRMVFLEPRKKKNLPSIYTGWLMTGSVLYWLVRILTLRFSWICVLPCHPYIFCGKPRHCQLRRPKKMFASSPHGSRACLVGFGLYLYLYLHRLYLYLHRLHLYIHYVKRPYVVLSSSTIF